ncbi:hypothetical protein [Tissierella sp.]|uniref:hypothetical protein n=1 Tax=Tissierella sp. TaxID=41274 RepID=UPI0028AF7810|nr:hypothetical protein [Tissierella sp.]
MFIDAIHNSKIVGQAYNVTHPESVSWSEYIDIVMKIVGKKVNIQKIDSKLNINSRQYFPFRDCTYLLDISKLRKDGLSNPKITLTEGLKRTYEWYCKEKPSLNDKKMIRIEEVLKM